MIKILFTFLISSTCFAQGNIWTLDRCIDTALANNLSIQKLAIARQITASKLETAKLNILPSVSANASHGYNWGQTIDLFTNQFATNRVQFDNFYLSGSLTLFQGLQNYYLIKQNSISGEQILLDYEIAKRNIRIDVSAAYLQVLMNQTIVNAYEQNYKKTKKQSERIAILKENLQATESNLIEVKAQEARDKYLLLKAKNDLELSKIILQNIMNVVFTEDFVLLESDKENSSFSAILSRDTLLTVSEELPEIIKLDLGLENQTYLIKNSRGRYYPSLFLNGSLGSGYSENNKIINPNGQFTPKPFRDQITQNSYQTVSMTLSIPIFNKMAVKNQVKSNQLQLRSLELDREEQILALTQKLQQLYVEIQNLANQKLSLETALDLAELSSNNMQLRYENGDASLYQLTEVKNDLVQIELEKIQNDYQFIFKQMMLGFYFE